MGKWKLGYAVFLCGKLLVSGTYEHLRSGRWSPDKVARAFYGFLCRQVPGIRDPAQCDWVCEWPELYANKPRYHADIKRLMKVGLALSKKRKKGWTKRYRPRRWKGNLPKHIHHPRLEAVLASDERFPQGHDGRDAVGIGLYHLGRVDSGGRPR